MDFIGFTSLQSNRIKNKRKKEHTATKKLFLAILFTNHFFRLEQSASKHGLYRLYKLPE